MNPDQLRAAADRVGGCPVGTGDVADLNVLMHAARHLADVIEYADSIGLDSVAHIARGLS